jgi:hypothetical protein
LGPSAGSATSTPSHQLKWVVVCLINIFIIGNDGALRSSTLTDWVHTSNFNLQIRFISPVKADRSSIPAWIDGYLGLHYGNRLTDGEWGCSIAHYRAQEVASSISTSEWSLFLEDDAELSSDFDDFLDLVIGKVPKDHKFPMGIQFYFEESLGSKNLTTPDELVELKSINSTHLVGTVCYALNKEAIEEVKRFSYKGFPVGKADFPAWRDNVNWHSPNYSKVSHPQNNISSVGERVLASRKRGLAFKIAHFGIRVLLFMIPVPLVGNKFKWELGHVFQR